MKQLDMERVIEGMQTEGSTWQEQETLQALQVAVYVMCGGGFLGRFAAEQPADFYIDDRCGRLPYPNKAICQAVRVLEAQAKAQGLDPHNLPAMLSFHQAGVF